MTKDHHAKYYLPTVVIIKVRHYYSGYLVTNITSRSYVRKVGIFEGSTFRSFRN